MTFSLIKKHIRTSDAAAAGVFLLLAAALFTAAFYAHPAEDEMFYYSLAQRLVQGDRMLVDDWHLAQLATVLQILPYRAFVALTGGTEGLLVALRLVFVAADLGLFCFFWYKQRLYSPAGLISSLFLCADLFAGIAAINYYNFGVHGLAVIGLLLFCEKKEPSRPLLFFCGVLLAFIILAEPTLIAAYLIYTLFTAIGAIANKREKHLFDRYGFILRGKIWLMLTLTAALVAAVFAIYLLRGGFGQLIKNLPYLFRDSEYGLRWYGNRANAYKLTVLTRVYGKALPAAVPVLLILCACSRVKRAGRNARLVLFLLCTLWCAGCYCSIFLHLQEEVFKCSSLPVFFYALFCILLCERTEKEMLCFWFTALFCSVFVDYVSEVTVLYAGRLAYIPAAYCFTTLLREFFSAREEKNREKRPPKHPRGKTAARVLVCTLAAVMILLNGFYVFVMLDGTALDGAPVSLDRGPLKGLRCGEEYARGEEGGVFRRGRKVRGGSGRG